MESHNLLPSAEEMAAADRFTIAGGVTGEILMERAGTEMFRETEKEIRRLKKACQVCILCGPGNNGGDGLVLARLLRARKKHRVTVLVSGARRYSAEFMTQALKFCGPGAELFSITDSELKNKSLNLRIVSKKQAAQLIKSATLLVDAMLGTGQSKAPRGDIAWFLKEAEKNSDAFKIALDIPSGISAGSGEVFVPHFCADLSLTVQFVKRGMLQYPARTHCGTIKVLDIGIQSQHDPEFRLLDKNSAPPIIRRKPDAHKGDAGHVLVVGGSADYPGAPVLSAHAAARSGAGLVSMLTSEGFLQSEVRPEIILRHVGAKRHFFELADFKSIMKRLPDYAAFVIGPGLGQNPATGEFLFALLKHIGQSGKPAVIDADALNLLALKRDEKRIKTYLQRCILTPHPGEAARLLSVTTAEVQKDRYKTVQKISSVYGCGVVVLKGAASLIYSGHAGFVNSSGNPYMATAGSGDVLSGIIAGFLAQNYSLKEAAMLAVFLHGLSGDLALLDLKAPLMAGDLINYLPAAFAAML